MNAQTPVPDLAACGRFIHFWTEVTGAPHVTLVAIHPDISGLVTARTFARAELDAAKEWVALQQEAGRNCYFQPNETPAGCDHKPSKTEMVAALCRFADVDPMLEEFAQVEEEERQARLAAQWASERDRLARLADFLAADTAFPPTVIIDSGGGLQPIWAVAREPLSADVVRRVEDETRALEHALGAKGTHNVDRLLRLPGTLNFPNAAKRKLGRGVSLARLRFSAPNMYSAAQAAGLAPPVDRHVAGSGLARRMPAKAASNRGTDVGDDLVARLVAELKAAGAEAVSRTEQLPPELAGRLLSTLTARRRFADRWAGMVDDLTKAGRDDTRSGTDMSLAAMAKAAGFSHVEAGLVLCAYPHGKANNDEWKDGTARLRHVARAVLRSHDPAREGEPPREDDPAREDDPVAALVAEFNARFAVVNEGGRAVVYSPVENPILRRRYHDRLGFDDLQRLYMTRRIKVGVDGQGRAIMKPAANVWLAHPDRAQFIRGVTFDPSGRAVPEGMLNLWQGFAVQPRPGSWQRMRDHIRDVVCRGNVEHSEYLLNWIARMLQSPAEQGEVAVVMRGGEGTGKGTLARALKHTLGQHGLHISNGKHLTGNFNGHLRDCVFLFADEAFFAGDRAHVGVLKAIITEPYLAIEGKYQNAVQAPNFLHLMMASNEDWVVPASLDARRFFVLEVSDARRNDHAYFAALWAEMENGGYEAMLHDLLRRDLTLFNPRGVPLTEGLQTQRKLSLNHTDAWWLDVLHKGYVFQSRLELEVHFSQWHETVTTELLFASYTAFVEKRGERRPLTREDLGRFLKGTGARQVRLRDAVVGEHITDVSSMYGTTRKAATVTHPRPPGYHLGPLRCH